MSLGMPKHRKEDGIKTDFKTLDRGVDLIDLAQDREN
jgi:hypothetical protein